MHPGERVAYQLPNWGEFVVLTVAILRIGAVCCPLMPIFRRRELEFMLGRSQARVMIVPERFRGREHAAELQELLTHVPELPLEHVLVLRPDGAAATLPESGRVRWHDYAACVRRQVVDSEAIAARLPAPDATAQLLFTSGTTGEPKGVLHRNDALSRAAFMEVEHLGLGRDDQLFIPSPLAHQTGFLYGMWNALVLGGGQILQDTWDPQLAAQALREWGGSFVQAATPFLADLVRVVEEGEPAPSALRIFVVTGAAVPRALAERATAVLDTAVCRRVGLDRVVPGHAGRAHRPARPALGHRRPRAGGHRHPRGRRPRHGAAAGRGGPLRGAQPDAVCGLPRPPGPDRGRADR